MPKIVELRQNRSYIVSNFDGYKLSLESIPILRQNLNDGALHLAAGEDQYSFLHSEIFCMQNHLYPDFWERTMAYFISKRNEIVRVHYNVNASGKIDDPQVVYKFGREEEESRRKGDYNYSLRFISEKYCVVCNGKKKIILFETGDRIKAPEWKVVAEHEMEDQNFIIYDCRLDVIQEKKQISLALGRVTREEGSGSYGHKHSMNIYWAKWAQEKEWTFSVLDVLEGKGSVRYCNFEPRAESLIISSNHDFHFKSQKEHEAEKEKKNESEEVEEKAQLHDGDENAKSWPFSWTQTVEDISVKLDYKPDKTKSDYDINCAIDRLKIKCGDETILDHKLHDQVDSDLFTWTMANNSIELCLVKSNQGAFWPSLLSDGDGPSENSESSANKSDLPIDDRPVVNLEAPIEDCDFPMGADENDNKIERFHLPSKSVTHSIILGGMPPIFSTSLRPGFPWAIATRQDVDACLWLQQYNPSKPDEWSLRHEGNLHAFGYVQASKQQRKFIDCAPDLSYAVICESHRHIFLYRTKYDTASGLRNRNGPQVNLGKQHLINLPDDTGEILGVATATDVCIILTENSVLYLQI